MSILPDPTDPDMRPGDEAPPGESAEESVCPHCGGTGRLGGGDTCPTCEGTGTVIEGVGGG